jgi:hypothetical protein
MSNHQKIALRLFFEFPVLEELNLAEALFGFL